MLKSLIQRLVRGTRNGNPKREGLSAAPRMATGDIRAEGVVKQAIEQIEHDRLEEAERLLHEAIGMEPAFAEAHFRLGWIYEKRGALEDAADCYELAVHYDPGNIKTHMALAALRKSQGHHAQVVEHYRQIVELDPEDAAAHTNLCLALHEVATYDEARLHGERAIAISPKLPEAHHNLALVLRELGYPARALQHFQTAFGLKPRAEIAAGLAHAYRDLGRLKEAVAGYDRALRLKPDLGDAIINRAYAFLLNKEYERGWAEYEKRFAATGTRTRDFGIPPWNGEPLRGKTILVHAEQGLGDEIMFASCLPDILAQAERVIIECSERLAPLFKRSFPRALVRGGGKEDPTDWAKQYAPVDFQLPIGSLPRWFRPDETTFPRNGGYLRADPRDMEQVRDRLGVRNKCLVGLSWRGGGPRTRGYLRTVPLEMLTPLFEQDAVFVSLQHGVEAHDLDDACGRLRTFPGVTESPGELAALISMLDLVVSVDNTTAQLAGAVAQPVWIMLSASPEWRYGASGETMPWYPSAKLFRQGEDRRWEPVIQQVVAAFSAWSERRGTTA